MPKREVKPETGGPAPGSGRPRASRFEKAAILALLAAAVGIRLIHPWQTWALGQSDAYSHLQFVQGILRDGAIPHSAYPPLYPYLLAGVARLTGLDPYYVCRYGGAVFGAGLVAAVYLLMRRLSGPPGALCAAGLVAGCPLFNLLLKTGVGCFANQLGLVLLPLGLAQYARWQGGGYGTARPLVALGIVLASLALSVPMMLLHAFLLLAVLRVAALAWRADRRLWVRASLGLALAALPSAVLLARQVGVLRGDSPAAAARMLTGGGRGAEAHPGRDSGPDAGERVAGRAPGLARDFASVKRWGHGNAGLNFFAVLTTGAFLLAFGRGLAGVNFGRVAVGAWGTLASLNVHLGVLQFTRYQREGWSLLIAAACLGGIVFEAAWERFRRPAPRAVLAGLLAAAVLAGFRWPPEHRLFSSPAENEMVRLLRAINGDRPARADWPAAERIWRKTDAAGRVVVVSRRVGGFEDGQGDPVRALRGRCEVRPRPFAPEPGAVALVFADRSGGSGPAAAPAVMMRLQPELSETFLRHRAAGLAAGAEMESAVRALSGVKAERLELSPRLVVWLLEGPGIDSPPESL